MRVRWSFPLPSQAALRDPLHAFQSGARGWISAGLVATAATIFGMGVPSSQLHAADAVCLDSPGAAERTSPSRWSAGYEFVFAQARFSDSLGLLQEDEDLLGNSRIEPLNFEHDFQLSPRTWIAYQTGAEIGLRAAWWQLDSAAGTLAAQPSASGFGEVSHPELADVDLSSVVPAERLVAASSVELYAIDLEVTKAAALAHWELQVAAGLRHAAIDHDYDLMLRNAAGDLAGEASLSQRLSGLGPTLSIASSRTAYERLRMTAGLRTSLLLANSETRLRAVEDADLATSFTTAADEEAQDLLPILETHLRAEWVGRETGYGRWLLSSGVEAQWWSGVGTVNDAAADLAILGLTLGTGWEW